MIIPIEIYNNPILRKKCKNISFSYPKLKELIFNMFETMYNANGIGLAAPQIGINIRLFIVDIPLIIKNNFYKKKYKKVFINPKIIDKYGTNNLSQEGCLSIPSILEKIIRKSHILIEYYDENWKKNIEIIEGFVSRVIQHEYDHIEGILFIDLLPPIKKKLISKKLKFIKQGKIKIFYPNKIIMNKYNKYIK